MCFKKIWHFLWESDSILSWLIDLILIFLIVKFIVFPLFSLILATPLPFVIIESGSMHHEGSFDSWFLLHGSWYLENNITIQEIKTWPWSNGLDKGDIIIVKGLKDYNYKKGDVIVFQISQQRTPIIHRIVDIKTEDNETLFSTKGDHNDGQWPYELTIKKEQIIGKATARIAKIGWIKLAFVEIFR
ncbi:MAG: signal peptidase I [Candidatus Nanoarchaeia archaeon]